MLWRQCQDARVGFRRLVHYMGKIPLVSIERNGMFAFPSRPRRRCARSSANNLGARSLHGARLTNAQGAAGRCRRAAPPPRPPGPPDSGVTPHERRSVPSLYEIAVATAVPSQNRPTNRGDRHAECEPGNNSPSTTTCATVFGLQEVLSGKSRINAANF